MNRLSLWLAWKYLCFSKKDKNISFMIRICFLGIFIGAFALMLTLIITNGFEKVIHEKLRGITSQAIMYAHGKQLDDEGIKALLEREFKDEIKAVSSSSLKQVIIDRNKQQSVLFLKGIEPTTEVLVSSIGEKITLPLGQKNALETLLQENQIMIGYKVAQQYGFSLGSEVTLMIPEPSSKKKIFLNKKKAVVSGIYKVGIDEYDSKFAYCSLAFFRKLFKEKKGVTQISLAFTGPEDKILAKLKRRFSGLTVSSWKELYPALVSSLKLEKYVSFFILALITLVACMNMISLLFMQIQQKRRDIAIFKSMGMSYKTIKYLFMSIGMSITFFASILGLSLAACAGYFLEKYPFITLPDVYYVTHLPARMDLEIFIAVFICAMLLGLIATWIPCRKARKIHVVDVLRKE